MNDCCKSKLVELIAIVNEKFAPMMETSDPNTPMTEEQFGIFKVLMHVGEVAEKLAGQDKV